MAKSFLTDINLNKNSLLNAKVHVWGSAPSGSYIPDNPGGANISAVQGQISSYQGALYIFNGTAWVQVGNALTDSTSTTSSTIGASATAVKSAYDLANAALPKAGGNMAGAIDLGSTDGITGYKITGLKNPSNLQDAATKSYVDGIASGVNAHDAVKYATTGALGTTGNLVGGTISKTYSNGTSGVGATLTVATSSNWTAITIDGQSLTVGDRVLIKDETSAITGAGANVANGIYTLAGLGLVTNGNNPNQIDVGTASSSRIVVNADNIDLASVSPTTTGTAGSGTVVQSHTVDTYGRVTATTYAAVPYAALATGTTTTTTYAASVTTVSARKATGTISGNPAAGASVTVNHGWGLVTAQLFDSSGNQVEVDVTTSGGITTFVSPTTLLNGYQYVIIG